MRRYAFHEPLTELSSSNGLFLARSHCSRCRHKASGSAKRAELALYQSLERLDSGPPCVVAELDDRDFPKPAA